VASTVINVAPSNVANGSEAKEVVVREGYKKSEGSLFV